MHRAEILLARSRLRSGLARSAYRFRTACLGPTSPVERFPRRDAVGGSGTGQDHTYYRDGATASSHWTGLVTAAPEVEASLRAQQVVDTIRRNGASFFEELVDQSGLLRAEVEEALGEVSLGLVTSDSFAGLRALIMPASRSGARKGRRVRPASGMAEAGRWALARRGTVEARTQPKPEAIEHVPGALGATAWCSGGWSNGKRHGCRHGANCCAFIGASRAMAKSAAGASLRVSPVNNSPCQPSACCASCAAIRERENISRFPPPIL